MPIDDDPILCAAIEDLYQTFARYPLPPRVVGCSHCTTEEDNLAIHSASLRKLGADALTRFARKAMTTWGTPEEFRHFLPRIFELLASNELSFLDPEIAIGKLGYGEWQTWPADEQEAVTRFLHSLWLHVLSRFPNPLEIDSCICAIGQAENDLSWYLKMWDIAGCKTAACHFAEFLGENTPHSANKGHGQWKPRNAFWAERPKQMAQVVQWVLEPRRIVEIESAFFAFAADDKETEALLSDGATYLNLVKIGSGSS